MSSANKRVMFNIKSKKDEEYHDNFLDMVIRKDNAHKGEVRDCLRNIDSKLEREIKDKEVVSYAKPEEMNRRKEVIKKGRRKGSDDDFNTDGFITTEDMPINVNAKDPKRFEAYLAQREVRIEKLRRQYQEEENKNIKEKPDITPYELSKDRKPVYKRNYVEESEAKSKALEEARIKKMIDQHEEHTYSPDIKKKTGYDYVERGKTVDELMEWKKERDGRMALQRMENIDKNAVDCTFKPKLNNKSKQIMSHYEAGTMPIKQSKKEFIEEFLKKEKNDNYKPRINSKTNEILQNGYKLNNVEVKQLKPAYLKNEMKESMSNKPSYRSKSASKSPNLRIKITEQDIIQRFRYEADPNRIKKSNQDRILSKNKAKSVRNLGSSQYSPNKKLSSTYGSKQYFKNINRIRSISQSNKKRSASKDKGARAETPKKKNTSIRDLKKPIVEVNLRNTESSSKREFDRIENAIKEDLKNSGRYRKMRQAENSTPSRSPERKEFDDRLWYLKTKERNRENTKKRIEDIIYRDSQVSVSPPRSRESRTPKKTQSILRFDVK